MEKRRNEVDRCSLNSLLCMIRETFSDPAERNDFEEWYRQRYGEEYIWKFRGKELQNDDTKNSES